MVEMCIQYQFDKCKKYAEYVVYLTNICYVCYDCMLDLINTDNIDMKCLSCGFTVADFILGCQCH